MSRWTLFPQSICTYFGKITGGWFWVGVLVLAPSTLMKFSSGKRPRGQHTYTNGYNSRVQASALIKIPPVSSLRLQNHSGALSLGLRIPLSPLPAALVAQEPVKERIQQENRT